MKKYLPWILFLVASTGMVLSINSNAQVAPTQNEGSTPYTPTKLEWLILLCNVSRIGDDSKVQIEYDQHPEKPNSIRATITYSKETDERLVKYYSKEAKDTAVRLGKQRGWDWVDVELETSQLINALGN